MASPDHTCKEQHSLGQRALAAGGIVFVLLVTVFARAQPPAEEPLPAPLTEQQAVLYALRNNPALHVLHAETHIAKGQIVTAAALANPILGVDVLHLQAPTSLGAEVSLKWTPPQPVERSARRSQAEARSSEVTYLIAEQEWLLAAQVRMAHALVVELQQQHKLAEEALHLRQRLAESVRARLALGGATRLEQNLTALALSYTQRDLDDLSIRSVQAHSALATLLGVLTVRPLPVEGSTLSLSSTAQEIDPAALVKRALAVRPALQAAHARITQRQQVLRAERSRRFPWLTIHGAYRENNNNNYPHDVQVGLDLTLPVLNLNRGPIQVAEAELERERAVVLSLVQDISQRVYAAAAELSARRRILSRFVRDVQPLLQEHEQLLELAFRGAELDLGALLAAEESVLRSRRDQAEARIAYRRAQVILDATVGESVGEGAR